MSISEIDAVRARLTRFRGRYLELCERSGLGYSWLCKFAQGQRGQRPSFDLITRLQTALAELEAEEQTRVKH